MRIRNVFFLFFCFLYCFFLSAYSQAAQKTELPSVDFSEIKPDCLPYKFVVTRSLSFNNESITERFFPINCTENGIDKLLMISCGYEKSFSPNYISIGGLYPQAVKFQKNYYGSTALSVSDKNFDVNNDGIKEIFLSELRPDAVYLHIIDSEGRTLHSILCAEKPYGIKGKWESVVSASAFMDINGDGTSDIIITIETDYGFKPRGIYAFDLKNNKFLWKYNTGFVPTSLLINDINGDSKREIIIGSNAPANGGGVKINGTDDSHSYLTVLDSAGKCLKSQVIGGEFTSTTVYARDLDGDGSKELMVSFTGHGIPAEADFIAVWNPVTGNFGPKISIAKTQAGNLGFTDIDRDGKDDVIIGWDDGRIELRNHNLDIIKFRKFIQFSPGRIVVADFNNDGEKEIFVSGAFRGRSVILMLSQKIELLAYVDKNLVISENCIVNQGFGKNKLLLAEGPPGVFLYNIEKQFALVHKISWGWLISGLFIGIFLAGFSYTFFAVKQSKKTARREIESVFDLHQVGLLSLDENGVITSLNRTMEHILRRNREFLIGINYKKIFNSTPFKEITTFINSSYKRQSVAIEKEINTLQDGTPFNLLVNITLSQHENTNNTGRLVSVRDITDVVDSKRVVAWAGMAQKLAHEIKTPLSTLMLSAQRLQMEHKENFGENGKSEKYLRYIIDQVNRLRNMTDDFLKFANIEKPQLEPVKINRVITESLDDFSLRIGSEIQTKMFFAENLPNISVDKAQLIIAIQNLINNGITAMGGKGILTITTKLVQKLHVNHNIYSSDSVQIAISDTGKGISQKDITQLFQPFFSKSAGGTGMGLVIVKKIIEDHSGTLHIESKEEIGTTVFVTIPVRK